MAAAPNVDPRIFRNTLSQFATGVVVATGCLDGQPAGFAAQSFASLSLDPPLVAVCPGKSSTSWPKLRQSGSFCINVLTAQQRLVCEQFAKPGAFASVPWRAGITGSPILDGVMAYIDCELVAEHDAGDHVIAVGRVRELSICDDQAAPLLFFRGGYGVFAGL